MTARKWPGKKRPRKHFPRPSLYTRIPFRVILILNRVNLKSKISPPKPLLVPLPTATPSDIDVTDKVQQMLAATRALKGDDNQVRGSLS